MRMGWYNALASAAGQNRKEHRGLPYRCPLGSTRRGRNLPPACLATLARNYTRCLACPALAITHQIGDVVGSMEGFCQSSRQTRRIELDGGFPLRGTEDGEHSR